MSFADAKMKIKSVLEGIFVRNLVEDPSCVNAACILLDGNLGGAIDATQKVVGTGSLLVTSTLGVANKTVGILRSDSVSRIDAVAGLLYTHSVFLKRGAGGAGDITGRIGVEWYNASAGLISREYGDGITVNATIALVDGADWRRESYTTVAPSLTAFAVPFFEDNASTWTSGKDVYFDAWMFNQGGLEDYIDGSMPGCVWEGAADASTSKRAVKRVYENPPGSVQDFPSFIMYAPSLKNTLGPGLRVRNYRPKLRLVVSDQDLASASAAADSFREILVTAFDSSIGLSGAATQCWVEDVDEIAAFEIGGKWFIGFDSYLNLEIKETVNFG